MHDRTHRDDAVRTHGSRIKSPEDASIFAAYLCDPGRVTIASHVVCTAQFAKRSDRIRREVQSEAKFARTLRLFEDLDLPSLLQQRAGRGEAADPRSDDECRARHVNGQLMRWTRDA